MGLSAGCSSETGSPVKTRSAEKSKNGIVVSLRKTALRPGPRQAGAPAPGQSRRARTRSLPGRDIRAPSTGASSAPCPAVLGGSGDRFPPPAPTAPPGAPRSVRARRLVGIAGPAFRPRCSSRRSGGRRRRADSAAELPPHRPGSLAALPGLRPRGRIRRVPLPVPL